MNDTKLWALLEVRSPRRCASSLVRSLERMPHLDIILPASSSPLEGVQLQDAVIVSVAPGCPASTQLRERDRKSVV